MVGRPTTIRRLPRVRPAPRWRRPRRTIRHGVTSTTGRRLVTVTPCSAGLGRQGGRPRGGCSRPDASSTCECASRPLMAGRGAARRSPRVESPSRTSASTSCSRAVRPPLACPTFAPTAGRAAARAGARTPRPGARSGTRPCCSHVATASARSVAAASTSPARTRLHPPPIDSGPRCGGGIDRGARRRRGRRRRPPARALACTTVRDATRFVEQSPLYRVDDQRTVGTACTCRCAPIRPSGWPPPRRGCRSRADRGASSSSAAATLSSSRPAFQAISERAQSKPSRSFERQPWA